MTSREQFGSYLLLKKLAEDSIGETFRAGKLGSQGMEQVVLLRVFNGEGIDGNSLWQEISERGAVLESLKSPNIGNGVDLGQVRGVPYVAYDYISGKDLASLMARAASSANPIPVDHCLLVAERIALGLAVAYETKIADQRVLHGLAVPQLVMLSNEGETRVLGFESAAALRTVAARSRDMARYMSPEARGGAPLAKQDDVWSLGVVLFELLTGQTLPPSPTGGYGPVIDGARVAALGSPLPPEAVGLLKRSLVPKDQRIPDAVTWHKTLSKLMIDGQHSPTTFNLAFFMHNLFRDDIERESKEIEAEKTIEIPSAKAAAATAPVPVQQPAAAEGGGLSDDTEAVRKRYEMSEEEAKGGSKKALIAVAAVLLLAAVGAGLYFGGLLPFGKGGGSETPPAEPVADTAPPGPPVELAVGLQEEGVAVTDLGEDEPAEPAPAGPSEQEIRAQIDQILAERTAAMEATLRAQYDDRLQELQRTLEETQQEQQAQEERQAAAEDAGEPAEPEPGGETGAQGTAGEEVQVADAGTAGGTGQEGVRPGSGATPPAQGGQPAGGTGQGTATGGQAPAAGTGDGGASAGGAAATQPEPEPEPEEPPAPRVRMGDLVTPGPGVRAPKVLRVPEPRYPPVAQRLNRQAVVFVRVLVDENGRVERAELDGKKMGFGFDEAALDAAQLARFEPATKEGVRVKMWMTLKVEFKR